MPALRSTRREVFAQLLARGVPAKRAHREAGFSGDARAARKLAARPTIQARLIELRAAAAGDEQTIMWAAYEAARLRQNARRVRPALPANSKGTAMTKLPARRRAPGRPWKPSESGNPAGLPKMPPEVRDAARAHTAAAIKTLAMIMRDRKAPARARIEAAEALLDRGWGRPTPALEVDQRSVSVSVHAEILALVDSAVAEAEKLRREALEQKPRRRAK